MKFGFWDLARFNTDNAGGGGDPGNGGGGDAGAAPEGLPPQFWDEGTKAVKVPDLVKSYGELSTFKSEYDARMAALPQKPDDYKFDVKLPDTIKVPDGYEFKIDEKDPRIPAVREFAARHKLPQDVVNDLVVLNAQFEIERQAALDAEIQAEMKKLGSNGPARVQAATDFLKANLTESEFDEMRLFLGNAEAFTGLEKIIAKALTQRVPGGGGDPPKDPPKPPVRTADLFYGKGN